MVKCQRWWISSFCKEMKIKKALCLAGRDVFPTGICAILGKDNLVTGMTDFRKLPYSFD